MPADIVFLVVDKVGVRLIRPASRRRINLVWLTQAHAVLAL
jgi:hypothetical protein